MTHRVSRAANYTHLSGEPSDAVWNVTLETLDRYAAALGRARPRDLTMLPGEYGRCSVLRPVFNCQCAARVSHVVAGHCSSAAGSDGEGEREGSTRAQTFPSIFGNERDV